MSALWLAAAALAAPACTEEQAPCVPQCGDRLCGDNGCGGTCGLCASGLECNAGQCRCPAGKDLCGADCFNTQTSLKHCGECGNACATGQACESGACKCPSGQALCNGQCVSLATSLNCGACGVACAGGTACEAGACKCPAGTLKCGSKCVDPLTDVANCGACGTTCPSGGSGAAPVCADGKCARRCLADAATELCDGTKTCCGGVGCTDTKNDPNNCGGCGEVCPSDTAAGLVGVCDDGSCRQRCANDPAGQYCAKPSSGGASACNSAGRCAVSCTNSAETVCSTSSGATCVNLSTDDGNCGLCGTRCASNQDCLEKNCATKIIRCTVQAASGWQTCNASVLPATAGTSVTATQLVDIGAFGTTGGWISGFFESLATDATRGPGRDTNPYATGDYRYNTSYRFNELLWRVNGTVSGPGPERGFNDPPVAAGRAGTIQLRINVLDGELNWADGSLTVAVSVTTP
jgi:hypothetical protein